MFDLGTQELILIFIVAFLVFGPKRLPELGRTLGKGITELKSALRGVKESLEEAESEVTDDIKKATSDLEKSVFNSIESHLVKPEEEKTEQKKPENIGEDRIIPASAIEPAAENDSEEETEEPKDTADKEKTDRDG